MIDKNFFVKFIKNKKAMVVLGCVSIGIISVGSAIWFFVNPSRDIIDNIPKINDAISNRFNHVDQGDEGDKDVNDDNSEDQQTPVEKEVEANKDVEDNEDNQLKEDKEQKEEKNQKEEAVDLEKGKNDGSNSSASKKFVLTSKNVTVYSEEKIKSIFTEDNKDMMKCMDAVHRSLSNEKENYLKNVMGAPVGEFKYNGKQYYFFIAYNIDENIKSEENFNPSVVGKFAVAADASGIYEMVEKGEDTMEVDFELNMLKK